MGQTASVRDLDLPSGGLESLLVRELVRARNASASQPREAPNPSTCLVTRAQVMQRVLSRTQTHALALLEGAIALVQDAEVTQCAERVHELARDLDDLMGLEDLDLGDMLAEQTRWLATAVKHRLLAIADVARHAEPGSLAKMVLMSECADLRSAAGDFEEARVLLRRVVTMNADFDVLCSFEDEI